MTGNDSPAQKTRPVLLAQLLGHETNEKAWRPPRRAREAEDAQPRA